MKKRQQPDFLIFFATVTLLGFGIVMVFSASSVAATAEFGDSFHYLKTQTIATAIGLIGMVIFMQIDYHSLKKWAPVVLAVAIFLLGLVLFKSVGVEGGGARRWLQLGPFNLQPSEVAKIGIVLFLASILSERKLNITKFWHGLFPLVAILGVLFLLILKQPDLGTAMTLAGTAAIMLFVAGAKISHLVMLGCIAAPGVWLAIMG
jgi:cell division protein FtsW